MAKKKGSKAKAKKPVRDPDPLPGPELLRPVLTYSEDDPVTRPGKPPTDAEASPPVDDENDQVINPSSWVPTKPAELTFDLEDCPDFDLLHALTLAEENSDDQRPPSSATEDFDEEPKVPSEPSVDSADTPSESTDSATDHELEEFGFDELSESSSADYSHVGPPSTKIQGSPFGELGKNQVFTSDMHHTQKFRPIPGSERHISKSQERWITDKFTELLSIDSNDSGLFLTLDDLLETNLDFDKMGPEVITRLKQIAERSSSPDSVEQFSDDYESPDESKSSFDSHRIKDPVTVLPPAPPLEETNGKDAKKKSAGKGKGKQETPLPAAIPGSPPKPPKRYPAEKYDERRINRENRKPFLNRTELRAIKEEQDAWAAESAEDIGFIEYRRQQFLLGKDVPLGDETDYELKLIAERAADKAFLNFEATVKNQLRKIDEEDDIYPVDDQDELPSKPIVPVAVKLDVDANDEDTTSDEDPLSDSKRKTTSSAAARSKSGSAGKHGPLRTKDPYSVPMPVHEDDQHDYYNSDRSSSEHESWNEVVCKEVIRKLEKVQRKEKKRPPNEGEEETKTYPVEIAGQVQQLYLPLDTAQLKALNVEDLYSLAHDLQMPPSELRKELLAPWVEVDCEQDPDEFDREGWEHVQAMMEYEKTPAFYAVQIEDLENQIYLKREQWIELEIDHRELSIKSRTELANLEQFVNFLTEQKQRDTGKVIDLQNDLQRLKEQLDRVIQHHTAAINWLLEQKEKLREICQDRKTTLQFKLYALRENVDKQRRMETRMATLKKQGNRARANFTKKMSKLMLDSARQREKLFKNYERKMGKVFIEYQRALILSMNDNLQAACCEHVFGRERGKKFSDKAVQSIRIFQRANDKLNNMQKTAELEEELLKVSKDQAGLIDARQRHLDKIAHREDRKLLRLEDSVLNDDHALIKWQKTKKLSQENARVKKHIDDMSSECRSLSEKLCSERIVNKQMENHIQKLAQDVANYLRYQEDDGPRTFRKDLIEPFEDRFINFLQYAAEIEVLRDSKKKLDLVCDGDFGLIPRRMKSKKRLK